MARDPNVSGQAYAFMAMTPVEVDEHQALTDYLRGLYDRGPSPFAKLRRTHMARFVVVPDFYNDPAWRQRREEHLDVPYLIFTSNLDGDIDSYLDELCEKLAGEATEIWGRCIGCPEDPRGDALKAYLEHNRIDTGLFFAAYDRATVQDVERSLRQREKMIAFAVLAQGLEPEELQRAFVREFAGAG